MDIGGVNRNLAVLREVMRRSHSMYKGKSSSASCKRAKEMSKDNKWILAVSDSGIQPVLMRGDDAVHRQEQAKRTHWLRLLNVLPPEGLWCYDKERVNIICLAETFRTSSLFSSYTLRDSDSSFVEQAQGPLLILPATRCCTMPETPDDMKRHSSTA